MRATVTATAARVMSRVVSVQTRARMFAVFLFALMVFASACGAPPSRAPTFHARENPALLSEWGQFVRRDGRLALAPGVTPYEINTALFSDYALKLRSVWIPEGAGAARYDARASFEFPVGAVITKTFYYPRAGDGGRVLQTQERLAHFDGGGLALTQVRLIETRILVRREDGWHALPYVWDDAQQDAHLQRTGALIDLTLVRGDGDGANQNATEMFTQEFGYLVPNVNQCAGCHVTDTARGGLQLIGVRARHLNRAFRVRGQRENQLRAWTRAGLLSGAPAPEQAPRAARWPSAATEEPARNGDAIANAARAYLDINCAHCHSRTGPADASGLFLAARTPAGPNLGICKAPIAAGRGTGGRRFDIVPGDARASIFHFRMASVAPAVMMPELGRALAHDEGVALVAAWIDAMTGDCADARRP